MRRAFAYLGLLEVVQVEQDVQISVAEESYSMLYSSRLRVCLFEMDSIVKRVVGVPSLDPKQTPSVTVHFHPFNSIVDIPSAQMFQVQYHGRISFVMQHPSLIAGAVDRVQK